MTWLRALLAAVWETPETWVLWAWAPVAALCTVLGIR